MSDLQVSAGHAHPLGATPDEGGVNFSIFSEHATGVELLLFDEGDAEQPFQSITLDRDTNRTFHFWHCRVEGARAPVRYAYRVDGPRDTDAGHRFNPAKVLLDPYARGVATDRWDRAGAVGDEDNLATSLRGVVVDTAAYDWEGDRPLGRPAEELIIYELHVGGFTRNANSGVAHPGTFAGVAEKIPYLLDLGVTAVELLPVMVFDEASNASTTPDGHELTNYWGYSTVGFFAPHAGYCTTPDPAGHLDEFRDMVKALHRAGIRVICDVVFNHTDEGNHEGPAYGFRGLDNSVYYHLVKGEPQYYMDYSGCGNTVNCNHPVVNKFILDCLQFWAGDLHVDGFRFDEGSILSRDVDGAPMTFPPVIWNIELSERLADTFVVAEVWDAGGLYQVGNFAGYRWAEWNGKFRDDVRRFVKGGEGMAASVACRLAGSADLYQTTGRAPINSVNFITAHDGFTLHDLVSYDDKHNEANGEGNADGVNDNDSWNHGVEGETDDPAVQALRARQIRNFAALLLLSEGVPMFVMGDEVRRTQHGNNNAYCQDNELSWMDWDRVAANGDLFRFFKQMIALRKAHRSLHRRRFFDGTVNPRGLADLTWHGTELGAPTWDDPGARALAYTLGGAGDDPDLHVMINAFWEPLDFQVPDVAGRTWQRAVDTARQAPDDIYPAASEPAVTGGTYPVGDRSICVLIAR